MAVTELHSFRLKDPCEWTPAQVVDFIGAILPGHPCVDYFSYTSGYVLCSLEKEDLRRQAKSDEAANVIWIELGSRRKGAAQALGNVEARKERSATGAFLQRGGVDPRSSITLYVKAARQDSALELEVCPTDTVAVLKAQIALHEGTQPESQRLVTAGISMQDDRTLTSYSLRHGDSVLLIPTLRDQVRQRPASFAPRGLLQVPGSKAWSPSTTGGGPFLPVMGSDVSRDFPVSLEFTSQLDCEAFAEAAKLAPPWLEILPGGPGRPPPEAKARLDPETGTVSLEASTGAGAFAPNSCYQALAHFGGRGGQVPVSLVTGAAVSAC
eukprot:TRINITY_DN7079_c0_g1_i1.p1 TRINITY_DN7079_c0_g1~~TRINITY_DN7079_c0_g1_i1.p1  ORF type:complete len:325 (-),score=57.26 TRINITY_DN7079_c0_g1_i1:73-1047(-)